MNSLGENKLLKLLPTEISVYFICTINYQKSIRTCFLGFKDSPNLAWHRIHLFTIYLESYFKD